MLKFKVKDEAQKRLVEAMRRVPDVATKKTNQVLKTYGAPEMVKEIISLTPESGRTWEGKLQSAKSVGDLRREMGDLSFTLKPKKAWNYLVFPNRGIGRSNPVAQEFFERGVENAHDRVINKVTEALEKAAKPKI